MAKQLVVFNSAYGLFGFMKSQLHYKYNFFQSFLISLWFTSHLINAIFIFIQSVYAQYIIQNLPCDSNDSFFMETMLYYVYFGVKYHIFINFSEAVASSRLPK